MPQAVAQEADPTELPVAARQLPNFAQYASLNVHSQPAGFSYNDPVTGAKVVKLTSPTYPVANSWGYHDYSEAGPYISRAWGPNEDMHTINFRVATASGSDEVWLVDYQRGTGTLSNIRELPYVIPGGNALAFSAASGNAQIAYIVHDDDNDGDTELVKFNTAASVMAPVLPSTTIATSGQAKWLQVSEGDERIVFSAGNTTYVYNANLSQAFSPQQISDLDEPALDRAGNYVLLRRGVNSAPDGNCPSGYLEEVWYLWNLTSGAVSCRGGSGEPAAHTGWTQGYFAAHNSNSSASENFYYDPVTDTKHVTAVYADADFFLGNHYAAQWIQDGNTGTTQWYFGSNYEEGEALAQGWVAETSLGTGIYSSAIDWNGRQYQKDQIGVHAVYQVSASDSGRYVHTLAAASSESNMSQGTYYWKQTAPQRIYVRLHGDLHPSNPFNRIKMAAPGPVHNGVGVRRLDGSDVRLLAHTYSWPDQYEELPFATVSPDGKLALFASTMGRDEPGASSYAERTDTFIVEIPTSGSSNPLPGGDVVWINDQGLQKNGNTIVETCSCGTARAESQQTLASGDGFVEFLAGSDHAMFAVGIGDGAPSSSPNDIEFSLRFSAATNGTGIVEVRESGVYRTDTTYTEGQRFRIEVVDGDVNYFKDVGGTLTPLNWSAESPAALQYPVKVEAVLMGPGSSVAEAVVGGGSGGSGGGGDITWANLSNAIANANTLTESGGVGNSGAQSTQTLSGDGYMEFTAVETDKMRAVGLDSAHTDNTYNDIQFAIVLGQTGIAEVRQNGAYITDTTYTANTRFRIAIENGVIKYYKYVGTTLTAIPATNTAVTTFPVHVDAALYGPQSTITDVTLVPE